MFRSKPILLARLISVTLISIIWIAFITFKRDFFSFSVSEYYTIYAVWTCFNSLLIMALLENKLITKHSHYTPFQLDYFGVIGHRFIGYLKIGGIVMILSPIVMLFHEGDIILKLYIVVPAFSLTLVSSFATIALWDFGSSSKLKELIDAHPFIFFLPTILIKGENIVTESILYGHILPFVFILMGLLIVTFLLITNRFNRNWY